MLTDLIEGFGIGLVLIGIFYVYVSTTKWPKRERKAAPAAGDIYYVADCTDLGTHHTHTDASHCDGGHSDGGSCGH